jgi:hypothetical protein
VLGLAVCGSEPEIVVRTRVGPQPDPHSIDDREALDSGLRVLREVLRPLRTAGREERPREIPSVEPPRGRRDVEALIRAVRSAPRDELEGPARRLAAADTRTWPELRTALLAKRTAPKGDYRSLLRVIGGDVPNRYGYFRLHWKRAHGHAVVLSEDWYEDLLAVPRSKVSRGLRKVYRDCVLQTAMLRAATAIGSDPDLTADVVATLLDVAYLHRGTFRDEVGRAIRRIGDEAVPHLIRAAIDPPKRRNDDDVEVKKAAYARYQLDRMDRLHPTRAVAAVRQSPRLLADVLTAYGNARSGEAATVLLDHADAPSPRVRTAAGEAFLAYVTGPAPRAVQRTVRLLGGGTKKTRAYLSYRQRAAIAIRERLEAEAPSLAEEPCDIRREDGTTDTHCEAQPQRHTAAYMTWLDERRRKREADLIEAALSETDATVTMELLDRLLTTSPQLEAGDRLVTFFSAAASSALAAGDPARAGQLLRKSARLAEREDSERARDLRVRALLAEAAAPGLDARGREMLLKTASDHARNDKSIAAALREARSGLTARTDPVIRVRVIGALALLGLVMLCLAALGGPLRRKLIPSAHHGR